MRAPRQDMQEVVLTDSDVLADSSGEPPAAPFLARRIRRWWPVAAGAALVVGGVTVLSDLREGSRLARLAEVPGVLAPIDGPVRELWRSDGSRLRGLIGLTEVDGRLVGPRARPDGGVDVVAIDTATGAEAWRATTRGSGDTDAGIGCALPPDPLSAGGQAKRETGQVNAARVVACVVVDETETANSITAGTRAYATKARLYIVDASSGEVVSDRATDPTTAVATLGTDLVLSHIDAGGRVTVIRTDARGGGERWRFRSSEPAPVDEFGRASAWISVTNGFITVGSIGPAGLAGWVLAGDGRVVDSQSPSDLNGAGGWVDVLADGRLLAKPAIADDGTPATRFVDLTSNRSFDVEGYPAGADPDDGSLAGLAIVQASQGDALMAFDVGTGRQRWSVPQEASVGRSMIIDGRILQAWSGELRSIDGRTGDTVWTSPVDLAEESELVTDGRVVVLSRPSPGGVALAAYGLDDGRRRWAVNLPHNLYLIPIAGRLYGLSPAGIIALG